MPGGLILRDLSRGALEAADALPVLHDEPDDAFLVDHQRVRVAAGRRAMLGHPARLRVEAADGAVAVAGVPDEAFRIDQQAVRAGTGGQFPLVERFRLRVEAGDAVAGHDGDVEVAVRPGRRVARELRRRHRPFRHLALHARQRAGNEAVIGASGQRGAGAGGQQQEDVFSFPDYPRYSAGV
ncbi:MAG: hypothetical protein M5R42_05800 [Rhodocyclaceae bacterium]|nr:hypothetical protein [Rhodocyclaceae bacterium]